jgi:dipeptidyl aminopeptidase/acylaminoacyl peptidase
LVFSALFVIVGTCAYLARDIAPTHPLLAQAKLPPLIPVHDFYPVFPNDWGYKPSHDGSMIAWYGVEWAKPIPHVRRRGETKPFSTLPASDIDDFFWHPFRNELLIIDDGQLWKVNPEEPGRDTWVDVTPRGFHNWNIVRLPLKPDQSLVVSTDDRNPAFLDLYTVQQNGRGKELLFKNEGNTFIWWIDRENTPVLRMDVRNGGEKAVLIRDGVGDDWRTLLGVKQRDEFSFINMLQPDEPYYALSNLDRDRKALVTVDKVSGAETVIAEHPRVDLGAVTLLGTDHNKPDYITFWDGYPTRRALTDAGKTFLKLVQAGNNPVDFSISAQSPDGRFVTVARSSRGQSIEYFLYDLHEQSAMKLGEDALHNHSDALAETRPASFKARDGLEIPALLTTPRGVPAKNLPAIVVIHGGPAMQDVWGYNDNYQFLANRGYAVLSVNFRGSTGYGKAFRAAGYGEAGKGMQDDIVDAANWLVEEGIADKANMAVMGFSYGGYSAALAMTRDPGLFKAAIVESAILDVPYQMENYPAFWELSLDEMSRYFGDPDNPDDLEKMREISPQTGASHVEGAILLTVGELDTIVGVEQTKEFQHALEAAGKDVTAVYFDDEEHGYAYWQTKIERARLIEDFLAEHLGGRSGGFDYAELAAKYIDR